MNRDPQTLRPHPLIKSMPRWAKDSEEWRAFVDDIRSHGVLHRVRITAAGVVVDGWTRVMAARDLQLTVVPVEEVSETEAVQIIMREMCLRRNLSKGQRAYVAWPMFVPLAAEIEARHLASLKAGRVSTFPDSIGEGVKKGKDKSIDALGARIGVSGDVLRQARELHEVFSGTRRELMTVKLTADPAELRAFWEPRILDMEKPVGLGAALAGIAGKVSTEGRAKGTSQLTQLDLFDSALQPLKTVFAPERWAKTEGQFRDRMLTDFRLAATTWPPILRRALAEALLAGMESE